MLRQLLYVTVHFNPPVTSAARARTTPQTAGVHRPIFIGKPPVTMSPRTNVIVAPDRPPVPTPAPLLATHRGQFAHIPTELLPLALPKKHAPLLLQLPLLDWHTLNPHLPLYGADLFTSLKTRAESLSEASDGHFAHVYDHGIAGFCAQPSAVLFLANRAAGSADLITDAPGKSTNVTGTGGSRKETISPVAVARLHKELGTNFVTAPADAPSLPIRSKTALARRLARTDKQLAEMLAQGDLTGVLASVQGGDNEELRKQAAKSASESADKLAGYSIDGLYAGEDPEIRWGCVEAVVTSLPETGIRVLGGGHGGPADVVAAVRRGIDVVEGLFPFELAGIGVATDLGNGQRVNCRDRRWVTWKGAMVDGCACGVCTGGYSRGYVRHLFEVHEMMGVTLVAAHNLFDYLTWFERLRNAVRKGEFEQFAAEFEETRAMERLDAAGACLDRK